MNIVWNRKSVSQFLQLSFLILCFIIANSAAFAAIFYVHPDGSDTNSGLSNTPSDAWKTIQRAADTLSPGDTVEIQPGTYNEAVTITLSGAPSRYIIFHANGEVIVDAENIRDYCFKLDGASYIRIEGITCRNATNSGILLFNANNNILIRNVSYPHANKGIETDSTSTNNELTANIVYDSSSMSLGGSGAVNLAASNQNSVVQNPETQNFKMQTSSNGQFNIDESCSKATKYAPDEIIVKFKKGLPLQPAITRNNVAVTGVSSIDSLNKEFEVISVKKVFKDGRPKPLKFKQSRMGLQSVPYDLTNVYRLKIGKKMDVFKAIEKYKQNPDVEYAEPNYIATTCAKYPNDSSFSSQWSLNNTGQNYGTYDADIDAPEAWDITTGSNYVVISVVDTGVDLNHPDLASNIWTNPDEIPNNGIDDDRNGFIDDVNGWDFFNEDKDPMDDHKHGTHVAGISSAVTNNSTGIAGVSWNSKIMAVKVLSGGGWGWTSDVASGIVYAADNGADVINLSLGSTAYSQILKDAVDYAYNSNCVVVAAAGNSNSSIPSYPAAYENAIAVAATDNNDKRAYFSTYGKEVDVAAPGLNIYSTVWDNSYATFSGTSMAAPHVSGLAALILAKNLNRTNEEIRRIIKQTTDRPDSDKYIGTGRINAYKALQVDFVSNATAKITSPQAGGIISGTIDIQGIATDDNFSSFKLYYGEGLYPTSWVELRNSYNPVVNGILYSGLDTTTIKDGFIVLRLEVIDTNGLIGFDEIFLNLNNVDLTFPLNNDIFRAGDIIEFKGYIVGNFQNYTIEYSVESSWSTQGITLYNNGQPPFAGEILGSWDTNLLGSNFYTVRLIVTYPSRQEQCIIKNIYLDTTLKTGWPRRLDWDVYSNTFSYNLDNDIEEKSVIVSHNSTATTTICYQDGRVMTLNKNSPLRNFNDEQEISQTSYGWGGLLVPVISDINNDGYSEIICYKNGGFKNLNVFKYDGSVLEGWPVNMGDKTSEWTWMSEPLILDVDGDSLKEIVAVTNHSNDWNNSKLYIFKYDGTILPGYPYNIPQVSGTSSTIAVDIDEDGKEEILIKDRNGANRDLIIFKYSKGIISQFYLSDRSWFGSIESYPAVGNFDDDAELEIVSADPSENAGYDWDNDEWINEGVIYVYNSNGTVLSGWPVYVPGEIFSSPAVGDINGDGELEIVAGLMYASNTGFDMNCGGLYAFDKNGKLLPGWPILKGYEFWSSPSLADFDEDGDLEIVISSLSMKTYVIDHRGNILAGWPKSTTWYDYYSTVVGDINNDGLADIITTAGSGFTPSTTNHNGVYAWNFDGSSINGFPKVIEMDAHAPATIKDIDKDGNLELIASSDYDYDYENKVFKNRGSIYVWELETKENKEAMHWPTFHHDVWRTGLYGAGTIRGKVSLQGRGNHSASVVLELRDPGTIFPIKGYQVTTAADGSYTLTNVASGSYDLTAKVSNFLRAKQTNITITEGQQTPNINFNLLGGDCDNNNVVSLMDFSILRTAKGTKVGDPKWDARADFNGNGQIDLMDFSILRSNMGKSGEN